MKQNSEVSNNSKTVVFKLATFHKDITLGNPHLAFENKSWHRACRKYCQKFAQLNLSKLIINKEGVFIKIEITLVL